MTLAMLAIAVKKWNLLYKLRKYKYKSLGVQKELCEIRAKMCLEQSYEESNKQNWQKYWYIQKNKTI